MALHRYLRPAAIAGVVWLTAVGCGGDDDAPAAASSSSTAPVEEVAVRTVEIEMTDQLVYNPNSLKVAGGETVRFVFKNTGKLVHDALIGDAQAQQEHEVGTAAGDGHDDHHGGEKPPYVSVAPGATEELIHTFAHPGEVLIGCHQTGHWTAGMKLSVNVA